MGFRTVSTHGMKTTAKVILFFLSCYSQLKLLWLIGIYLFTFHIIFLGKKKVLCHLFRHSFLFFPLFLSCLPPPEKRSNGLFHQITKTHGTVIGVSSGIVLVLLIISILVQMKQPRKKVTPFVLRESRLSQRDVIETDGGITDYMGAHVPLETGGKSKSSRDITYQK